MEKIRFKIPTLNFPNPPCFWEQCDCSAILNLLKSKKGQTHGSEAVEAGEDNNLSVVTPSCGHSTSIQKHMLHLPIKDVKVKKLKSLGHDDEIDTHNSISSPSSVCIYYHSNSEMNHSVVVIPRQNPTVNLTKGLSSPN